MSSAGFTERANYGPANAAHISERRPYLRGRDRSGDRQVAALVRYFAVDDVGRVLNPLLCDGQIHGGIAQGVGQALMEDLVYDRATGQLLTGSFQDYCMPRADDFCDFELASNRDADRPGTRWGSRAWARPARSGRCPR